YMQPVRPIVLSGLRANVRESLTILVRVIVTLSSKLQAYQEQWCVEEKMPPSTISTSTGTSIAASTVLSAAITSPGDSTQPCPSATGRCPAAHRNGARHGRGHRQMVPDRDESQRQRQRHGKPLQLLRSRSDLSQCIRAAVDAHDLRLQ